MAHSQAVSAVPFSGEDVVVATAPVGTAPAEAGQSGTLPGLDLLSKLGHELRSPLNGIIGLARIAQLRVAAGQLDTAELERHLRLMQDNAATLLLAIERVTEVARLDVTAPRNRIRFDCRTTVADVVADLRPAAAARARRLLVDVPDRPIPVLAEPDLMHRLVFELVDNALRHGTGVDVRVRVQRCPGGGVTIDVGDDGPGIPAAERERIFMPFYRGASPHRDDSGSGLGLYLAQRLAARCDGELRLLADGGPGSTFTVHLAEASEPAPLIPGSGPAAIAVTVR